MFGLGSNKWWQLGVQRTENFSLPQQVPSSARPQNPSPVSTHYRSTTGQHQLHHIVLAMPFRCRRELRSLSGMQRSSARKLYVRIPVRMHVKV